MTTRAKKVTSVSAWKDEEFDPFLELPSGKTVKVRPTVGFRPLLKAGVIPNGLVSIVQSALTKGQELSLQDLNLTIDKVDEMMEMVDNVVRFIVIEPEIQPIPDTEEARNSDLLYVDEIAEEDKMFINQWATGGTRDLERFRLEAGSVLDTVRGSQNVGRKTQPARRSR